MHFCDKCQNMFYIKLENNECDKIIYYCKNCGNNNDNLLDTKKCILKETFGKTSNKFDNIVNKYTKLDITLPRINYVRCPNSNCESNNSDFDSSNREIIYIRYDDVNMKYLYMCSHCDITWNTEK